MTIPTYTLSDGTSVPAVAFGVGTLSPTPGFDQAMYDKAVLAIKNGYRHFDTAESYNTEIELGRAISESGIPRSEFYITSKVSPRIGSLDKIEELLRGMLKNLKTDYIDLFLIHNPFFSKAQAGVSLEEVWAQLETAHAQGLIKSLGISNFRPTEIQRVIKVAKVKPVVNQIELNPYCFEYDTVQANKENGIVTASYGPLIPVARHKQGPLLPLTEELAKKYSVTPAQILLRWQLQHGFIAVTSSADDSRQKVQFDLESFTLSDEDLRRITDESASYHFRLFGWGAMKKVYEVPEEVVV